MTRVLGKYNYLATDLLRTFVGVNLVILAFSEKLLNIGPANVCLVEHNNWNFLSGFGLNDRNFIIATAIVEILLGLSLILNKLPRLSITVLFMAMVATTLLLGINEATSHLLVVGLLTAVWIGPNTILYFKK